MNPIFEIRKKIEEFKMLTGVEPNMVLISRYMDKRIKLMLENRSGLIEFYPDVFQLAFRIDYRIYGFEVQLSARGGV